VQVNSTLVKRQVRPMSEQRRIPFKPKNLPEFGSLATRKPRVRSKGLRRQVYSSSKSSSSGTVVLAPLSLESKNVAHAALFGQQIAPWPVLIAVSPARRKAPPNRAGAVTVTGTKPNSELPLMCKPRVMVSWRLDPSLRGFTPS
jgi:hypothetical protein